MTVHLHRVEVLHNQNHRDAFFGLNAVLDAKGGKHEEAKSHPLVRVFTYWTTADVDSIPELAFFEFNVGDDPDFTSGKPHALALSYRAVGLRSLSVGDVLVIDGSTVVSCESAGWRPRSADELRIVEGEGR
jgi:hypothetical protein